VWKEISKMGSSMTFEVKVELNETTGRNLTQQGVREYLESSLKNSPSLSSRITEISVVPSQSSYANQKPCIPSPVAFAYSSPFSGGCFCVPSAALIAIGNI
jgi:hypothetical protein